MKLVYTHPNLAIVSNIKDVIESEGIQCILRNEFAAGGVGELSFVDSWPELWVVNDDDFTQASAQLQRHQANSEKPDWVCENCGESNHSSFEICWNCSQER